MLDGWRLDGGWWIASDGTRLRAISGGGSGGGKTTVTTQVPPKSEEELALIRKQNDILDIQIKELARQNEALEAIFPDQKRLLSAQTEAAISFAQLQRIQTDQFRELAPESLQLQKQQLALQQKQFDLQSSLVDEARSQIQGTPEEQEIRRLTNQRALAILRGESPPLSSGQQERINTVFGRAAEEARGSLNTFANELAAQRGLRVTDTPIGGEVLRQGRELAADLAAAKANAELNVGQTEQQFGEAVRQFQEGLRQQAFQNRLALTGTGARGPAGLPITIGAGGTMSPVFSSSSPGQVLAGSQGLLDSLSRDRLGQSSQTTRSPGQDLTGTYIGAGAGLVGAGITGYLAYSGALAAAAAASSKRFKKGIVPYDQDEYDRALEKVNATPITRWKYHHEPESQRPHTGPILETAPDDIKLGDTHIDLISYSGLLHAAVKAVDRKVERLKAERPDAPPKRPSRVSRFSALLEKAAA